MGHSRVVLVVVILLAILVPAGSGRGAEPKATKAYDLYVSFLAKGECTPKDGPCVTLIDLQLLVTDLRFVFGERKVDRETTINWYPVIGSGPVPSHPILVVMREGEVKAEVLLKTTCDDKVVDCWLTKQKKKFQVVLSVIPAGEDVGDELLDPHVRGESSDVVSLRPAVLHVMLNLHDCYAWRCDCSAKPGDWGATGGLEFYYALPTYELGLGKEVSAEFPLQCDDTDGPGTLTVRLIPKGSLKNPRGPG